MKLRQGYRPYIVAVIAVAFFAGVRLALEPLLKTQAELMPFACAVAFAALLGGLRAGIAASILSVPVCDYLFIEPRHSFLIYDPPGGTAALAFFTVLTLAVAAIIDKFQKSEARLREAHQTLQHSEQRFRTLAVTMPEIVFTARPDGTTDYISQGYCEYTGLSSERACAEWTEMIHPEDRQAFLDQWNETLRTGGELSMTYRIRRADAEYRWFKAHVKPVREPGGGITQWTGVAADIDEQKLLEQALAQRTEQLIASNEEFQKFAYRVGHDLKEPLRMIGIFTEILVKRNQDQLDAESQKFTGYILDGVARVQTQMRELLEYARAGSIEIKRELTDLNLVLASAIDNLRSSIIETGAVVTHDPLPSLIANQDRMGSVFQNLIGNALKYRASSAPRIHVSARQENEDWVFSVRDNGVGFEMSEADRIFTAFERLASNPTIQGSGLGLAIVKRIVEFKGGRIWAESEPGAGSTFFFTLPRSLERMPAEQARSQAAGGSSNILAS